MDFKPLHELFAAEIKPADVVVTGVNASIDGKIVVPPDAYALVIKFDDADTWQTKPLGAKFVKSQDELRGSYDRMWFRECKYFRDPKSFNGFVPSVFAAPTTPISQFSAARDALKSFLDKKQNDLNEMDIKRAAAYVEIQIVRAKLDDNFNEMKFAHGAFKYSNGDYIALDKVCAALESSEICRAVVDDGLHVVLKI